jgi:predicted secreted protein
MFNDARSKKLIFIAHCVLNQNSISDATADFPGSIVEIVQLLAASGIGIVQLPCPELCCLGLDRGDPAGASRPVVVENTRIRAAMQTAPAAAKLDRLVDHAACQILEYRKHGFQILGVVGINRSPSCGVQTTSKDNKEVEGEGVFIEALRKELEHSGVRLKFAGIKASELPKALETVRSLILAD